MPEVIRPDGPITPRSAREHSFNVARRGYDQAEVRAFLALVADDLDRARVRAAELEVQLAEALVPAAPAPLDIDQLTTMVGEETARVLRVAQEAAADLKARAEEGAARVLNDAHEESARIRTAAESLLAERTEEADLAATKLRDEAEAEVAAARANATAEAEAAINGAIERGREMVGEAQAARERILTDLIRRRKAAVAQLDQLKAGREALLDAYQAVRVSLDDITERLDHTDVSVPELPDFAARLTPPSGIPATPPPQSAAVVAAQPAAQPAPQPAPQWPPPAPPATVKPAVAAAPEEPAPEEPAPEEPAPEEPAAPRAAPAAPPAAPAAPPAAPAAPPAAPAAPPAAPAAPPAAPAAPPTPRPPLPRVDPLPAASLPEAVVGAAPVTGAPPRRKQGANVDALFASMRARSTAEHPSAVREGAADREGAAPPRHPASSKTSKAKSGTNPSATGESQRGERGAAGGADGGDITRSDDDERLLGRRDEVVEPIVAGLVRRLTRIMQDEQNDALDRLRRHRGALTPEVVLLDAGSHAATYRAVILPGLADAETAGYVFADGGGPDADAAGSAADATRTKTLAGELCDGLVPLLRERTARVVADAPDDPGRVAELLGAVYREVRSRRLEPLVADQVSAAFAAGHRRGLAPGTLVRWIVDDVDGPCPDCDDNALAGPTPIGDDFPTGQQTPPAHPGCRCVLGLATT